MVCEREPSGEEEGVGVREGNGSAEERMLGGGEAGGSDVGVGRRAGVEPEALALERIGWKGNGACAERLEESLPVDGITVDVEGGEGFERGLDVGVALAKERDAGGQVGEGLARESGEDAVGSELEAVAYALGLEGLDAVGETDGVPEVTDPVIGVSEGGGVEELSGEVGDDGDLRRSIRDCARDGGEVLQDGVQVVRMEGVADAQARGFEPAGVEVGLELEDGRRYRR